MKSSSDREVCSVNSRSFLGMCFNRNVVVGLAAVGVVLFFFAPNLALAALPFLLLAACPLSMLAMALLMGRGMQGMSGAPKPEASLNAEEQLNRLQAQRQQLEEQQRAVLDQIRELEQAKTVELVRGASQQESA